MGLTGILKPDRRATLPEIAADLYAGASRVLLLTATYRCVSLYESPYELYESFTNCPGPPTPPLGFWWLETRASFSIWIRRMDAHRYVDDLMNPWINERAYMLIGWLFKLVSGLAWFQEYRVAPVWFQEYRVAPGVQSGTSISRMPCNMMFRSDLLHLALLWIYVWPCKIHGVNCLQDTFRQYSSPCHVLFWFFCVLAGPFLISGRCTNFFWLFSVIHSRWIDVG